MKDAPPFETSAAITPNEVKLPMTTLIVLFATPAGAVLGYVVGASEGAVEGASDGVIEGASVVSLPVKNR